jgi:hypothetical protein
MYLVNFSFKDVFEGFKNCELKTNCRNYTENFSWCKNQKFAANPVLSVRLINPWETGIQPILIWILISTEDGFMNNITRVECQVL